MYLFTYSFLNFSCSGMARRRAWMICHPLIQSCREVMFLLFSHLDYGRSRLLKSPNRSVKQQTQAWTFSWRLLFRHGTSRIPRRRLQSWLSHRRRRHTLIFSSLTLPATTLRTCWASRERVESRRQDPSNFVAVSAPRPLKLHGSNPPLPPAQAAASGAAAAGAGAPTGDPAEGGQRSPLAHRWQISFVVLDGRCAVVCRNRTAI